MTDRSLPSETADALCITHDGSVAALDTAAMVAGLESVGRRRSGGRWGASFADHETFRVLCIGCVQDGAVRSRLETRCLERNTNTNTATQIITQDNIGVSAVAGTGTLPLHDNGRHNLLDPVDPANNASWLYPRLGSLPGDSGGGREPAGAGGWRVLLQVGFCPVGQVCGAGTGGGGGGGGVSNPVPVVARPALIPAVFRVAQGATPIVARARAGATISFSLSQAADASIAIAKATAGKRRGKACVKPTRKLRHASGCTLWKTLGTLTRKGLSTGGIHIPFTGRIGIKPLRPGQYRAAITAKATGRSSRLPARASLYRCPYRARP